MITLVVPRPSTHPGRCRPGSRPEPAARRSSASPASVMRGGKVYMQPVLLVMPSGTGAKIGAGARAGACACSTSVAAAVARLARATVWATSGLGGGFPPVGRSAAGLRPRRPPGRIVDGNLDRLHTENAILVQRGGLNHEHVAECVPHDFARHRSEGLTLARAQSAVSDNDEVRRVAANHVEKCLRRVSPHEPLVDESHSF